MVEALSMFEKTFSMYEMYEYFRCYLLGLLDNLFCLHELSPAYKGSSHRRKSAACPKFDMVWLHFSPIVVRRRGVISLFK